LKGGGMLYEKGVRYTGRCAGIIAHAPRTTSTGMYYPTRSY